MPNFNQVTIIGNIANNFVLTQLPSGKPLLELSLTLDNRPPHDNAKVENTYVNVIFSGPAANTIAACCTTDTSLFVTGKLKMDTWTNTDANKQSTLKIVSQRFRILSQHTPQSQYLTSP